MREATFVEVSPEMTLLLSGPPAAAPLPPQPMTLLFDLEGARVVVSPSAPEACSDGRLQLVIQTSAFERVGGERAAGDAAYHLPTCLRAIVLAISESALTGEMLKVYRLGKSIELLCETIRARGAGDLVPLAGEGVVSLDDARRIAAARRLIDECWGQKLTLASIARACGLNRAKLTRVFREMYGCTIAEALAERRLSQASVMLRTTDLPVSSIGYENGYLNNASFSRAFGRRFGVSPSSFRASPLLAA